jgi:hypothetical protein
MPADCRANVTDLTPSPPMLIDRAAVSILGRLPCCAILIPLAVACAADSSTAPMTLPVAPTRAATEDFNIEMQPVRLTGTIFRVADAEQVAEYARDFATSTAPESGAQYGDAVLAPLSRRLQEVSACYATILQGSREIAGTLKLILEVAQDGQVIGAATDPAAGETGLAAVGSCIEGRARTWRLPSRSRPGVARITNTYELSLPP